MSGSGSLRRLTAKVTASLRARTGSGRARGAGVDRLRPSDLHAHTGGIDVSYAPERDGDADPGEVVWTWVAYEDDASQGKDRPVLILGWDGPQLAGVQLSSKDHSDRDDAREWVAVGTGGWDPKARASWADASRLLRVSPAAVRREGSALDENRFRTVLARVVELHGWRP